MRTREFVDNCISLLGRDRVTVCDMLTDVSGLCRDVIAILYPSTVSHVQEIVRMANNFAIPLYPVSQGKNWGMGSQLPAVNGCAVLNLCKMNRVIEVNEQYGYAEIEAGVTQAELCDILVQRQSSLFLDVTGSGRDTSIVGCALDRGVAYNSLRAEMLINLTVVLGNGEILRTGFGHFPNSVAKNVFHHGIGPDLGGVFVQGSFGVVVSATVRLQYKSTSCCAFVISISEEPKLADVIEVLRRLRLSGIIQCVAHIANRNRTALTMAPLMFQFVDGRTGHATRQMIEDMIQKERLGAWSVVGSIMGTDGQVREAKAHLRKTIGTLGKVSFLTDSKIAFGKRVLGLLAFLPFFSRKRAFLAAVEPLYGMTKGIPTDAALNSVSWPFESRNDTQDLDRGDFGLVYCLPIIPASGHDVLHVMSLVEETFRKYDFKPYVTLNLMGASLETVITLAFDKRVEGQTSKAHACNVELHEVLKRDGYFPYRVGINLMDQVVDSEDVYWRTVRDVKMMLDPNGIIAPGRYCPDKEL